MGWIIAFCVILGIPVVLMTVGWLAGSISKTKEGNELRDLQGLINSLKYSDNTIYVNERNPTFSKLFCYQKLNLNNYKYNKEEIHVGAVTVGGVTTGGVYKTGGDYTVKSYQGENCKLYLKTYIEGRASDNAIEKKEIKTIRLSKELAAAAKDSIIKDYVKKDKIIVVEKIQASGYYCQLMESGRIDAALTQLEKEEAVGCPSKEKCLAIISWLSGKDTIK